MEFNGFDYSLEGDSPSDMLLDSISVKCFNENKLKDVGVLTFEYSGIEGKFSDISFDIPIEDIEFKGKNGVDAWNLARSFSIRNDKTTLALRLHRDSSYVIKIGDESFVVDGEKLSDFFWDLRGSAVEDWKNQLSTTGFGGDLEKESDDEIDFEP